MRAAVARCFILSLSSLILISLRGGLCTTCTSLPTGNNNTHYTGTRTPAEGFSSVTSGMASELSGCSKSIIGDDRHEIDTQGRQPKDGPPQLLEDIIAICSFLPVGALAMGAGGLSDPRGDAALSLQLPFLNKLSKSFSSITILLCSIFAHESLRQGRESANSTPPLIGPAHGEIHPPSQVRRPFCLRLPCMCAVLLLCFCFFSLSLQMLLLFPA